MVSDADKATKTTYTTDDIMAAILDLRKDNSAIQETTKAIQDSVAALEIRVKALELKPGGQAGLYPPPKDLASSAPQLPLSTSPAATELVADLTAVTSSQATAPATASFGLPSISLPLGQQRPLPAWPSFVTPQAPPHLVDTAGVPRYHKLDFSTYDGKEDPLGWLNRCEQFFWGQKTAEAYKVWLAAYHMTGTAQTWYMQLERNEGIPSWPRFKNRCHLRFGPPVQSNCLGELTRLRMIGTVAEYQEKFLALLGHVDALSMAQQVSIFTSGLIDLLKIDVELHNPQDLDTAMSLARAHELRAKVAAASIIEAPSSVLWPKKFQVFKDKYDAINLDTGLNNQLTKMILKWHLPGQKLAVGKPEYKTVIEAELGILCLYDEPVMELMRGLKYLMHSIVPEEKSKLAEEDGLQASQGLKLLLDRYGFDVKPEMVNQCIIETACNLYDCDSSLKKQTKSWRLASDFLEEVSSIDSKDWEIPKLATALKIVCYPEDEIVFGNPHKMFTPNELSKLVTDAPKYEDSGIVKAIILGRYKEMVFLYDLKAQHKKELASLIKKAKEAYEAEQTRDWRGERSFE
ncbi:hypothetical protein ACQ4PT_000853 [Festuca glaucescens]